VKESAKAGAEDIRKEAVVTEKDGNAGDDEVEDEARPTASVPLRRTTRSRKD